MKHMQGDMFTTTANAIGHGCNVKGAMGAGVAGIVARKFPETEKRYSQLCARNGLDGGMVLVTHETDENGDPFFVFNMMTQIWPGADARLELIKAAAANAVSKAIAYDITTIAVPQIGCGIGGLTWDQVEPVLAASERDGFEWEVWTL